jgi:hypothetical protein
VRIRLASIGAMRRTDAPAVAAYLGELLADEGLERRRPEELRLFFEMLARVGDEAVATMLADCCRVRGIAARFRKPTLLQEKCLGALRRMRSPEARAVVDELLAGLPRAFRELLENPFDEL